jgi:hypothetical protein
MTIPDIHASFQEKPYGGLLVPFNEYVAFAVVC